MNSPRWPPDVVRRVMRSAGVETASARAKTCSGGVMWSAAPARRLTGQSMRPRSTVVVVDAQGSADELVVAEEVLDEPQIEGSGDVLGVLEPVLEGPVALDMAGVTDMGQQLQLLADLVLRLDDDEAAEQELALEHAVALADQGAEEGQVVIAERLARFRG